MRHERSVTGRVSESPAPAHLRPKAAPREVAPGLVGTGPLAAHEHRVVELLRRAERLHETGLARAPTSPPLLGELDPGAVSQIADGVRKLQVLTTLHVGEDVAALAAAKAVPQPRLRVHLERRGLLPVEGAAPPELMAALPELHSLGHQLHEVGRLADPLLVLVGDHATHAPLRSIPRSPSVPRTQDTFPRTTRSSSSTDEKDLGSRSQRTKATSTRAP